MLGRQAGSGSRVTERCGAVATLLPAGCSGAVSRSRDPITCICSALSGARLRLQGCGGVAEQLPSAV